jgi:hypothetical protein
MIEASRVDASADGALGESREAPSIETPATQRLHHRGVAAMSERSSVPDAAAEFEHRLPPSRGHTRAPG